MDFKSRITRLPNAFDSDRGDDARELFPDLDGDLAKLIHGTAGCSPYLKSLMEKEKTWLPTALDDPEAAVAALTHELNETAPDKMASALRMGKRRIALISALTDLAGVWQLEQVTGALTDFADLAATLALRTTIGAEIRREKLPGMTEDDLETAGGMVALAMGKMGAHELNYSSDIDLICLFDETRFDPSDAVTFWDRVNQQDWQICESVQRGMQNPVFERGYYAPMEDYSLDLRRYIQACLDEYH